MSININVTLPLDVVAAMQNVPDHLSGDEAKAVISPMMAQAMLAAVKTLPFSVAAKSADGSKRKHDEDSISVLVKGCYRDIAHISINPSATVCDLKNTIRTEYGIPYAEQHLSFEYQALNDLATLQEVRISLSTPCEMY